MLRPPRPAPTAATGLPRAWFIDVAEAEREAECAFLCQEIYSRELEPIMQRITALERYSVRG